MTKVTIYFASTPGGVIGNCDGTLPWDGQVPSDLVHFRTYTVNKSVLMGGKTARSIYARNGRLLPDRRNLVLTHNSDEILHVGGEPVSSVEEALSLVQNEPELVVIGGAQIFELALPKTDFIWHSTIYLFGDTPDKDSQVYWKPDLTEFCLSSTVARQQFKNDTLMISVATYTRKNKKE